MPPINVVYIACPLSLGDPRSNVAAADYAQWAIMQHGIAVINQALTCWCGAAAANATAPNPKAWGLYRTITHDTWIKHSLALVSRADAVVRLPGESRGADAETAHARSLGIPVFDGLQALLTHLHGLPAAADGDSGGADSVGQVHLRAAEG